MLHQIQLRELDCLLKSVVQKEDKVMQLYVGKVLLVLTDYDNVHEQYIMFLSFL